MVDVKRAKFSGVYKEIDSDMSPQEKVFNSPYLIRDLVRWTNSPADFHSIRQVVRGGINVPWYADPAFREETRMMFHSKFAPDPSIQVDFDSEDGRKRISILYADPETDTHVLRQETLKDSRRSRLNAYNFDLKNLVVSEFNLDGRQIGGHSRSYSYGPGLSGFDVRNQPLDKHLWERIIRFEAVNLTDY